MSARRVLRLACAAAVVGLAAVPAHAAKPPYKCIDANGHVVYSDVPCPPPVPASAAKPAPLLCPLGDAQRKAAEHEEEQFLRRYPSADDYVRTQRGELDPQIDNLLALNRRLDEGRKEYAAVVTELEFYRNAPTVPTALLHRAEANIAQSKAHANLYRGLEDTLQRLLARWHCDVTRFAPLWAGAAPGSSACAASCRAH